jgi:uncharacterized membrane protein YcaP (DUF421 family)
MDGFANINWQELFGLTTPLLELLLRGTVIYLGVVVMFRMLLRREASSVGLTDLLVIVLVASAAESGISGGYTSVTDGLILIATVLVWDYILDWLSFNVPFVQKLLHPPSIKLMDNGRFLYRNMRRQYITEEELRSKMRLHGLEHTRQVKAAYMEGDGKISIVPQPGEMFLQVEEDKSPHE